MAISQSPMAPRCGVCVSIAALALSPACIFAGDGESRETAFTNAEVTAQTLNQAVTGPDYVYNTVDAYTVFDSSDFVYVGESYGSIDLLVRNTGRVNSFFGYVGYGVDSDGNVVTIEGTGATDTLTRWTSTGMLTIGVSGSANSFTVQDGADVVCGYVIVGDEDGSNKNKVTIDGTGSTWTISSAEGLTVGKSGRGARFFVVNGATLGTTSLTLGKNASSGANSLTITGYGSTATLSGAATIGDKGESNALYIEARGSLTTNSDIVIGAGDEADALLGCDNLVQVTGTGDTDTDTALNCEYGSVYVGRNGSDNTLSILGGALLNAYSLIVGEGASSDVDLGCNNAVTISGVGTRAPGPVSVSLGVYGSGNSLTVSDHAVFNANDTYVGMNASSGGNTVTLVNATWNASGSRLFVGYYGGSNSFIVQNGGTLSAGTTYVGTESGSNKNLISFDGASTWSGTSSSNLLTIGYTGRGNRMIVSGGSSVSRHNLVIGRNADSASNSVTIDGVGTTFTTSTTYDFHTADSSMIIVGKNGSNNSMYVSGGAAVTTWSLYVGEGDGTAGHGADNALSISGAGSSLTATSRIDVGWLGSGNSMSVGNEAAVQSDIGGVGTNVGSDNNSVTLSGASTWTITQQLHVGNSGNFNSMSVSGGSSVAANVIYSGNSGSDNAISVSGTGSTLTSSGSIYLGFSGGYRNKVEVLAGGSASSDELSIGVTGDNGRGDDNEVLVSGADSRLAVSGRLNIGEYTSRNRLVVEDGAFVQLGSLQVNGYDASGPYDPAQMNYVSVRDLGTQLVVDGNIALGNGLLTIEDSALVRCEGLGFASTFIQLGSGIFAVHGNLTEQYLDTQYTYADMLILQSMMVYDNFQWREATQLDVAYSYFVGDYSRFVAEGFEGYDNLGGYTVFTSLLTPPVPEPSTYAFFGGLGALAMAAIRKRRGK